MGNAVGSTVYALLVFVGTNLFGFVLAPSLGVASGLFPIDTDARAFCSLATLRGEPYLLLLSVASGALRERGWGSAASRVLVGLANTLLVWLAAVALVVAALG